VFFFSFGSLGAFEALVPFGGLEVDAADDAVVSTAGVDVDGADPAASFFFLSFGFFSFAFFSGVSFLGFGVVDDARAFFAGDGAAAAGASSAFRFSFGRFRRGWCWGSSNWIS